MDRDCWSSVSITTNASRMPSSSLNRSSKGCIPDLAEAPTRPCSHQTLHSQ
ncbi:hypothetical protein DPMN_129398 [Dreissena polymorpha]|uniref:Uncharacterized protein n=1 Tax=Dreissena polymorpha TaxID=45954 RepID=A0A9D4H148_DREPO|nr:hypothetical protein DPMN_129398 [Dreissena polymorpha]